MPGAIILFDLVFTCMVGLTKHTFIDYDDMWYLIFSPLGTYLASVIACGILFVAVKKVREIPVEFIVPTVNLVVVFFVFRIYLVCAGGLGLVHVCRFHFFTARGKRYMLLLEAHNGKMDDRYGKLRQNDPYFIFDWGPFSYTHGSFHTLHSAQYIVKGTYKLVNDTVVLLCSHPIDMAIIGHVEHQAYTMYENGIPDTLVSSYICGFPAAGDTTLLSGGTAYIGAYR